MLKKPTTTAQEFILHHILSDNAKPPQDYKAPHAYRGTPQKPHYPRSTRKKKLFKGHRP